MLEPLETSKICYDRVRCGFFIAECPIFEYYRDEPTTSRGRIAMAHAILNGTIEPAPGFRYSHNRNMNMVFYGCRLGVHNFLLRMVILPHKVDLA